MLDHNSVGPSRQYVKAYTLSKTSYYHCWQLHFLVINYTVVNDSLEQEEVFCPTYSLKDRILKA